MNLYMAVTADKYELPLYVAKSVEELSDKYGLTPGNIRSKISKNQSGKRLGIKFLKIDIGRSIYD